MQAISLSEDRANVRIPRRECVEEGGETRQLLVFLIREPGGDGDSILHLVAKTLRAIVHNDGLGEIPPENGEVFDVVSLNADAVLPEESMADELLLPVQQVHQLIRVDFLGGRKENYLPTLRAAAEEFVETGTEANENLIDLLLEVDRKG